MDPEIQKAILRMVEEAKGVAVQEIPLVLHDLLIRGVVENVILLLVGLCLAFVLHRLFVHMREVNQLQDTWVSDKNFKQFITGIGIAGIGLGTVITIGVSLTELFTIWLAPRAYLLSLVTK